MLSDLILEANERGLRVNNLFQLADWSWQANLRTDDSATEYGRGPTPEAALAAALDRALETVSLEKQTCVRTDFDPFANTEQFNLMDLITKSIARTKPNPFKGRL